MPQKTINPGIILVASFLTLSAVNALVLLLANIIVPEAVVLGTLHLTKIWALILSVSAFSLISVLPIPFINQYETNRGQKLTTQDWMGIYFIVNFIGIWLVARAAEVLGFGISSFWVAIALAIVLDFAQGLAMMQLEKTRRAVGLQ